MRTCIVSRARSRFVVTGAALALICAVAVASASARPTVSLSRAGSLVALPSLSAQVVAAVNRARLAHSLRALPPAKGLGAAALQHTIEMGRDGYFAHDSFDGTAFWKRLQAFYPSRTASCWSVGENLVYAGPNMSADEAVHLWLNSPEHRRNILDPRWQQMGVAAVQVTDAGGVYGGQTVTVITNDFGARSC